MRGRGFYGLVPRLLATWYWFDHEAIEGRARARAGAILYGTGPTRRQSTCAKDRARAKMGHEQSKRDRARERRRKQRDIASEESKAKAKNLTDTRVTLRGSLSETLQTTALPSSPLYLVPST